MTRETDAELVRRARRGDAAAFDALVGRHLRAAYAEARARACEAAEAQEVCSDSFLAALDRLEECRPAERFGDWLLGIVRSRAESRAVCAAQPLG